MSKLVPRESVIHLMESNVTGNAQGEKVGVCCVVLRERRLVCAVLCSGREGWCVLCCRHDSSYILFPPTPILPAAAGYGVSPLL